jgi:hypothetical protein
VNANFAATQTAVNSKMDLTAAPYVSGTRLKVVGFRSADGMAMAVLNNTNPLFDSMLGVYCQPMVSADQSLRCLPYTGGSIFTYYGNLTCTEDLFFDSSPQVAAGLPMQTGRYLTGNASDGGMSWTNVYDKVSHTTTVYAHAGFRPDGGVICNAIPTPGSMVKRGALVPHTNFEVMTGTTF